MTKDQFIKYLHQPELLDQNSISELREMIDDYPYFPVVRMLYLRNLRNIDSYKFEAELVKHAIHIPDRKVLYQFLNATTNKEKFELLPFDANAYTDSIEPHEPGQESNLAFPLAFPFSLIDETKSDTVGFEPQTINLIDKFIIENPSMISSMKEERRTNEIPVHTGDKINDGLITETLAQIYVKQKLYDEALKAYQKLSLKFPEKNSYFAAQIEKINKLISKEK